MSLALAIRPTLVWLAIACTTLLFAFAGHAAAAQRSPMAQPSGHVTAPHHRRIVAYADGSLTVRRHHRRHVVAYAD